MEVRRSLQLGLPVYFLNVRRSLQLCLALVTPGLAFTRHGNGPVGIWIWDCADFKIPQGKGFDIGAMEFLISQATFKR
jgi:hypothetical protein